MYATPKPTEKVNTLGDRFTVPTITVAQIAMVMLIAMYAWTAREMNGAVIGTMGLALALLHLYDHLFLVKRGSEHLFFLPRKESYGCKGCM